MSKPTPQDAATLALQKGMADAARAKVRAKMLQHMQNAPPGAEQMARQFIEQGGPPTPPVAVGRVSSFVIAEQPLFRAAVMWGEKEGFLKLKKGERVLGGQAIVTENGIFAEVQIGAGAEPEETEAPEGYLGSEAEQPDKDEGLDVLSQPEKE